MTPNKLDLDKLEGLAGRLREEAHLADEADLAYPHYTDGALLIEAASDLTALISYARELEADKARVDELLTAAVDDYNDLQAIAAKWKGEALEAYDLAIEWSKPDVMQLHGGEMTAQEIRTVRAMMLGLAAQFKQRYAAALSRTQK